MHIRTATPRDSTTIAALHAVSWQAAYRGILADEYLNEPVRSERAGVWRDRFLQPMARQYVIVAEDQGGLAGFGCAYGNEDAHWGTILDNLRALPSRQGRGIGSALISAVAAWSSENFPGPGLFLWVLKQNVAARRFYEHLEGKLAGERVWTAPEGTPVHELRYAWSKPEELVRLVSNRNEFDARG